MSENNKQEKQVSEMSLNDLYYHSLGEAESIFKDKANKYGLSWLLYSQSTMVKELEKKADRLILSMNNIQMEVNESDDDMMVALINYGAMLYWIADNSQISQKPISYIRTIDIDGVKDRVSDIFADVKELYRRKNKDYGAAWHTFSIENLIDYTRIRIYRLGSLTKLEDVSQQDFIDNVRDLINYATFTYAAYLFTKSQK